MVSLKKIVDGCWHEQVIEHEVVDSHCHKWGRAAIGARKGWATEVGQGDEGRAQRRDVVQTWGRAVGVGAERHVKRGGAEWSGTWSGERSGAWGRGARLGGETRKEAERRDGAMQHVKGQMIKC